MSMKSTCLLLLCLAASLLAAEVRYNCTSHQDCGDEECPWYLVCRDTVCGMNCINPISHNTYIPQGPGRLCDGIEGCPLGQHCLETENHYKKCF